MLMVYEYFYNIVFSPPHISTPNEPQRKMDGL